MFVFDKPLLICIMTTTIIAIHSINAKHEVLKLMQKIFIEKTDRSIFNGGLAVLDILC